MFGFRPSQPEPKGFSKEFLPMRQGSSVGFLRLAAACILMALIPLTGCKDFFTPVNNNPGGSGTSSFVYVTNAGGTLTEYSLTSGVLAQLSGSPISLPLAPTSIVVAPNDEFVFIGTATGIFLYTINSDGTLTEGNDDTVVYLNQAGLTVSSMAVDATSSWLLITYQNSTELDAVPIDPTTGIPTSTGAYEATLTFGTRAPQIVITPANTNVFVALGSGGTEEIGFTPTATNSTPWSKNGVSIAPLQTSNVSDTAVAVDPTSAYLYITEANSTTATSAGTLRLIKISNLGTSTSAELDNEPTGVSPSAVLADLSGDYAYVTNSADGTISGFSLSTTTQKLTSLGTAFPTEKSPVGLVEDRSKTYIMDIGNAANPNLWLYSFDASSLGSLDVGSTTSTLSTSPSDSNGIAATH
jgi:6-phosphogluconolactonase